MIVLTLFLIVIIIFFFYYKFFLFINLFNNIFIIYSLKCMLNTFQKKNVTEKSDFNNKSEKKYESEASDTLHK